MKVNFQPELDGKRHRYCSGCYQETVKDTVKNNKTMYECSACGKTNDRLFDFNPPVKFWIADDKELKHETVGVLLFNNKRLLLFDRTIYPYGHTIPAGHLELNEDPKEAALRELEEETGIKLENVDFLTRQEFKDLCRKGADYHLWNLFIGKANTSKDPRIDSSEGKNPVWVTVEEALGKNLTDVTRKILVKYKSKLI